MFKKVFLMVLLLGALLGFTACGDDGDTTPIRIGLTIDDSNRAAGEAASRALAQAMEEFLGIPVVAYLDISYQAGTEAMRGGHLDIMLVSAFNYIHTSSVVDVEMLVSLPIREGTVNNSVFITRADRHDINALEDLQGKTMAFVSATSTSGFIFPVYHLTSELALDPDLITHSGYFFDTVNFSGGHEHNIFGVEMGDFDAAAIGGMFIENMEERGLINSADFKIIAATEPVPNPAYIIRSELDSALIANIRDFFLQFDQSAYFAENWGDGSIRFTAPDLGGFAYVRSVVNALGLNVN
ncbi:MAG: phosphate/phosphite/phosphonate ABC transporter substrate-binding protein [Defluviitaleaceae bacterium]|nr:phosphate/phosphite/phosphonate ABC transporter substrate-binding protein [Defluviitaleaceae bacterium]MCL2274487.1 phosphate/phosphite/phosphonate ABC transporter substrate-binding protein [Defluviitaleaceae bacterium]